MQKQNNFNILNEQIPVNEKIASYMHLINEFSHIYYDTPIFNGKEIWKNTYWQGIETLKCPFDLWLYQEIICTHKPDYIIECGVAFGGTTAFLADMCKLSGKGEVIGIDIQISGTISPKLSDYNNIHLLEGNSLNPEIVEKVFRIVGDKNALVILDSDHKKNHVLQEMLTYSKLIPSGGYLIVEDTNINGHPVLPEHGPGPMEAVEEFLEQNEDFYIDKTCHKFLMTFNPNGYLKRL